MPNVSYCEDNNEVHYNTLVNETKLVVYYDIQDISEPTKVCTNYNNKFTSMEIDSGEIIEISTTGDITYQFNSVGQHIIKYEFEDPTIIGNNSPCFYTSTVVKRVIIPNIVTSISNYAFSFCPSLTSVTIGNSVTSIGSNGFSNNGLTEVIISDSVTNIGMGAFNNCSGLTSVTIGNSVTNIDGGAFNNCSGLTSVTVETTTPPTLGDSNVFGNTNNCPIYVPSASVDTYKAASGWSTYASRIQAIPTP